MYNHLIPAAVTAALAIGAGPALAATISIDTFTTVQRVQDGSTVDPANPTTSEIAAPEVLGGVRFLSVEDNNDGAPGNTILTAGDGTLEYSNVVGVNGTATLGYDGINDGVFNPLAFLVDLTPTTRELFFTLDAFDQVAEGLNVTIDIFSLGGGLSSFSAPTVSGGTPSVSLAVFSGNADFSQVSGIRFTATGTTDALDGSISGIGVSPIPLPASSMLLLGGLGGMVAVGARRRRKHS
jgi:hypothetical protein